MLLQENTSNTRELQGVKSKLGTSRIKLTEGPKLTNILKCFPYAWHCAFSHLIPLDNKFIFVSRYIYLHTHLLISQFI